MWMRRRRAGAAVLAAATVLLSASTSPPAGGSGDARPRPATDLTALALVAVPARYSFDDLAPTEAAALEHSAPTPVGGPRTPPRPPRTGAHGSSPAPGTPQAVLAVAYRQAVAGSPKGCHLRPEHLAAIGQVESGSIGGRSVTAEHRVTPAIYGPLLDGGPFAVVHDSDGGHYDGDGQYDRAMGPLQFLPGTWRWAGRDGDGDGRRDPQNVFDAALATAGYLCPGGRDLSRTGDLRSAVLSYNQSGEYYSAVLEWVSYFRQHGLAALTSVAFRVGSGGRASALAEPEADDAKAAKAAAEQARATPTKAPTKQPPPTASDTPTTPATSSPSPTPTQPSSTPTTSPTTAPSDPTPTPTTPAPTTTTPPPASATSAPPDPDPSPAG